MSIYCKNSEGKLDRFLQEPEIIINDRGTSIKYAHLHIQFGTRTAIYMQMSMYCKSGIYYQFHLTTIITLC